MSALEDTLDALHDSYQAELAENEARLRKQELIIFELRARVAQLQTALQQIISTTTTVAVALHQDQELQHVE